MASKNEITLFTFPVTSQTVRVTDQNGEPWFIRNDVCEMLGHKNPSQAVATHCKPDGVQNLEVIDSLGRKQLVTIINEANFNRLVMRSNVKHALEAQDWVCEEVLPSIRKTGGYGKQEQPAIDLSDPAFLRSLLGQYAEKALELTGKLAEAAPKVEAMKRLEGQDGSMCVTDAAKTLKMRPKELFDFLSQDKWAYKRPGNMSWIGYQDKLQSGLLEHVTTEVSKPDGSTSVRTQMKITAKGIAKLAEKLGGKDDNTPLFA